MPAASAPAVYLVTIDGGLDRFRRHLATIQGATLVRELPPGRVVVALRSHADRGRLAELPGVRALTLDRLEHPDRSGGSRPG